MQIVVMDPRFRLPRGDGDWRYGCFLRFPDLNYNQKTSVIGRSWGHRDPLVKISVLSTRRKGELLDLSDPNA
jgi:hypothetical protein